jgi:phospholipid-binding lipoprotein MlaA
VILQGDSVSGIIRTERSVLKTLILIAILLVCLTVMQAHAESSHSILEFSEISSNQESESPLEDELQPETLKETEQGQEDTFEEADEEEVVRIADPLYPWNKAMYHVNDKLYFWMLKPIAKGYSAVVPEDVRLSVSSFFDNLAFPIRFVSNLLQLKMKNAGTELFRFVYNSTAGVCGLADAAKADFDIRSHDEDLGQTLGTYGIGHGVYIVWPFLGPSSLRDTVGTVGDWFLNPVFYVEPIEAAAGITVYDEVNETSFRIGDYEDLKKSAIDPYVAIRDAYAQHRKKKVEE